MGSQISIKSQKAELVFPKLVPQNELDSIRQIFPFRRRPIEIGSPTEHGLELAMRDSVGAVPNIECKATVLSIRNLHEHGDLYLRYLRARRDVFIVQKGWHLPETDGMEFDQYDTPLARWITLESNAEIVAGVRISPTTAMCGNHSYMLRDAQLGLLPGLPEDMLFETAPVRPDTWEATRLFVTDAVLSDKRSEVQSCLMRELASAARGVGATQIIGIVPAIFCRWLKRIGMTARAVGPVKIVDGDKVQAALMDVDGARYD